jgi:hypothetical protein
LATHPATVGLGILYMCSVSVQAGFPHGRAPLCAPIGQSFARTACRRCSKLSGGVLSIYGNQREDSPPGSDVQNPVGGILDICEKYRTKSVALEIRNHRIRNRVARTVQNSISRPKFPQLPISGVSLTAPSTLSQRQKSPILTGLSINAGKCCPARRLDSRRLCRGFVVEDDAARAQTPGGAGG